MNLCLTGAVKLSCLTHETYVFLHFVFSKRIFLIGGKRTVINSIYISDKIIPKTNLLHCIKLTLNLKSNNMVPLWSTFLLENDMTVFQVQAPARAGAFAPLDVKIPAQITTLGPEKTSFFQALQIPTKITKGVIEILVTMFSCLHLLFKLFFVL